MGGGGAAQGEGEDLPQANVKRVVKTKLQELALGHYGEERDVSVNKDALLAFSESAKIFIHFLSATSTASFSEKNSYSQSFQRICECFEYLENSSFEEEHVRGYYTSPSLSSIFESVEREEDGRQRRANEICRESKRQTVNADDVLKAVEELDFPEFSEPLMRCLAAFRKDQEAKKQDKRKSSGASTPRKRKSDGNFVDDNTAANGDYEDGVAMADDDDTTDN